MATYTHDHLTAIERDYLLRSALGSLAYAGVIVARAEAERLLDEVLTEPLVRLGDEGDDDDV